MKLKPCPFCKRGKPYIARWMDTSKEVFKKVAQVKCNCGASGAERYGEFAAKQATAIWNERVSKGIIIELNQLKNEERLEIFNQFCKHCGDKDIYCSCWNDE